MKAAAELPSAKGADARRIFGLLAAFVAVWTLYGAIAGSSGAIHHDTAEAYVWGREFQLGYYKHPPFWAWIAGAWFTVVPAQTWAFCLLSTINAGVGLWGSWTLIGDFETGRMRAAATFLLLLTPFFTFLAFNFNANSIFLSLWPWTLHFFVRSIEHRRAGDAVAFGIFMAAAVLSKYFAAILAATCFIAAVTSPGARRYFLSSSPYLSALVAVVLLLPHIGWLVQTGFMPFQYFRHETGRSFGSIASHAAESFGAMILLHAAVIGVIASCSAKPLRAWGRTALNLWRAPDTRMLAILAVTPTILTVGVALVFRNKISDSMLIGTVSLVPLLLIKVAEADGRLIGRSVTAACVISVGALVMSPLIALGLMRFSNEPAITEPRVEAALAATRIWRSATQAPLTYVSGSHHYANAISFYSPDHPHVFIDLSYREAPWVTPAQLAHDGLLIICEDAETDCSESAERVAGARTLRAHLSLAHTFAGLSQAPVHFTLFLVLPQRPLA